MIFPVKFSKNEPLIHLPWLLSETRMYRLRKYMIVLSLRQDRFSTETMKFLRRTPAFLYFKTCDISSRVQQKRPSQTPLVAPFRDTYAPTSKKYVSTEPKRRSLTEINNEIFRCHSSVFIFQKMWLFQSNSEKTTISDTCGGPFQRQVCTNFQKICFYWGKEKIIDLKRQWNLQVLLLVFIFQNIWYFQSKSGKTTLSDTCGGSFQRHVWTDFQKIDWSIIREILLKF